MPREMRFSRLLPLALALALIGLTALWGAWLVTGSGSAGQWPFALSAAFWPVLAWAGCRGRRRAAHAVPAWQTWCTRHAVRARPTRLATRPMQPAPPPRQPRNRATPASAAAIAASPEAKHKSTGERGPELAGAFKR